MQVSEDIYLKPKTLGKNVYKSVGDSLGSGGESKALSVKPCKVQIDMYIDTLYLSTCL